jgi:polyhydroxybutyrate depolymerase
MRKQFCLLVSLLLLAHPFAGAAADGFEKMTFTVDGVVRTALVYVPTTARTKATPVVFVFHGHGGNSRQVARSFDMNHQWPDAISVYMQGLPTPGVISDPEGKKPGWQAGGGVQGDRDLKFFDAVLARLKKDYQVDAKRIYCTGHSNGGYFTYLLWLERGDVFAAVAPSSAAAKFARQLKPKPSLIIGGSEDPLVKFEWQKLTMAGVRKVNGCSETGEPWAKGCTIYSSKNGTPEVTFIFPGGHEFNPAAPALIVKFFKEHPGEAAK